MKSFGFPGGFSRRKFIGTLTGAAAMVLIDIDRKALASVNPSNEIITDYEGRLCYNENPLGPAPLAIAAIHEQADMAHRYPDWFADSLVSDLASHHQVSSNRIVCGCGATEILRLSAMAFAEAGHNVVGPYPSYTQFLSDAQFFGSDVIYTDLHDNYKVDLQAVLDAVDGNTTCVCITNPNNPTATLINSDVLSDFVDSLPSGVLALIDEAYYHYIHDSDYDSAIKLVRQGKNVVVVRTFSKVYGLAGARIGYAVGPTSAINSIKANRIFATISRPSLEAAKAALNDTQHIVETTDLARYAKNYCYREFWGMGLEYIPSETSFFMVDVGDGDAVRSQLSSRGIYVRSGWGMHNHIRVSCGTLQEMQDFIAALRDILPIIGPGKRFNPPLPTMTELFQAYPNPFNSSTTIRIFLPKRQRTSLEIFDIHGRLVKKLADGLLSSGEHGFIWKAVNESGQAVSSGSYFYRLKSGEDVITRRMILIK